MQTGQLQATHPVWHQPPKLVWGSVLVVCPPGVARVSPAMPPLRCLPAPLPGTGYVAPAASRNGICLEKRNRLRASAAEGQGSHSAEIRAKQAGI